MDQEEFGKKFYQWTIDIFRGECEALSFDDIYSTTFLAISQHGADFIIDSIKIGFGDALDEKKRELSDKSNDELNDTLTEFSQNIYQTITKINSAFQPIIMLNPAVNLEMTLLDQFRNCIFESEDFSYKISNFIISYAHKLPGSLQIDSEKPMINFLKKILCKSNSKQWSIFIDAICESTDSYCLLLSSTMLQDQSVRDNPLIYLGVVLEAISNEEKLWDCFSAQEKRRFRDLMITCLIYDIKDEYLFQKRSKEIMERAFFEDFDNFKLFDELTRKIFNDAQLLTELADMLFDHFGQLVDQIEESQNTVASACSIIETLVNIFERLDILSESNIVAAHAFTERLSGFKREVLQNPKLNFEFNAARYIGRAIELMCTDTTQEKETEQKNSISQVAKIISFSLKKMEFIESHNTMMIVRLCQFAGQQYKLEQGIIKILEPYMPPTLSEPFQEKLKMFTESENVNKEWLKTKYGSNLTVFVIPNKKADGISTKFENVHLPKMFEEWRNAFSNFFTKIQQQKKLKLQWVFEENMVIMDIKLPNFQFQLKAPLLFSIVLYFLIENPGSTYSQIEKGTQLSTKDIDLIVKKAAAKSFKLFIIEEGPTLDQNKVKFNMAFKAQRKKFSLILGPQFSLRVAHKSMNESRLSKKKMDMYCKFIMKHLKENGSVSREEMHDAVIKAISASFIFDDKEYEGAISQLINSKYIHFNGKTFSIMS